MGGCLSSDNAQQARNRGAQALQQGAAPAPPQPQPAPQYVDNFGAYLDQVHAIQPLARDPNLTVRAQLALVNQANSPEWTAMRAAIALGRLAVSLRLLFDRQENGLQVQVAEHRRQHQLWIGQEVRGAGACESVSRKVAAYLRPLGVRATGLRNLPQINTPRPLTGNHAYCFFDEPNPQPQNPNATRRVIVDASWKQFGDLCGISQNNLANAPPVLIGTGAQIAAYLTGLATNGAGAVAPNAAANIAGLAAFYG